MLDRRENKIADLFAKVRKFFWESQEASKASGDVWLWFEILKFTYKLNLPLS